MGGSYKQVDLAVVRAVIAGLGDRFATRDVSEAAPMLAAHPGLRAHRNYHAFVGRALSEHRVALGLNEVKKRTSRGSVWDRKVSAPPPAMPPLPASPLTPTKSADLGPQYAGDNAFTARLRRHQSWYRASVLGVPCGVGPRPNSTKRYGNMLTPADGARGLNFLTPAAHAAAKARVAAGGGAVEAFRLSNNLLSSMPMCFNLFGPLQADLTLATRLVEALLPGEVSQVTAVHLEYAPSPASDYLDDRTAFDAFIEYRRPDGALAALGVETKLTEPFSQKHYDRPEYRRWMRGNRSPWLPTSRGQVDAIPHNQLWRDHLLAIAVRDRGGSPYASSRLLLLRHPEDQSCASVVADYRVLLKPDDDTFLDRTLDDLMNRWEAAAAGTPQLSWMHEFRRRYLDLHLSAS
jgi:hypothetical protein